MNRICTSLYQYGFEVTLVGRKTFDSMPLLKNIYKQKRLFCFFKNGPLFYFEYNVRLFFYLLFQKKDAVCCIDLDTILPVLLVSKINNIPRIYDAHELFTELKEVITRPKIKKIWMMIEKFTVPKFPLGYTVSESIAEEFFKRYSVKYSVIRNMPQLKEQISRTQKGNQFLFYQGAVNEGRGFEFLIPAMKHISCKLVIAGDGNFMEQMKELIKKNNVDEKVKLLGMVLPTELNSLTEQAFIGISLVENIGLNQYWSLTNKYFDYIHAGIPQVTMNYPEYQKLNSQFKTALLIDNLLPTTIAEAINKLLTDEELYVELQNNCFLASKKLNWQNEEKQLVNIYTEFF
ncbi:MAG: glycosyltransferase [Chitinophagaceae bacterium]|nr:MAG: glycosyltransferase [Chitinophagaceae bacterium]